MNKPKYEKPLLVELGFDSEVMGIRCKVGSSESVSCKAGSIAKSNCSSGPVLSGGEICEGGSAPYS